MGAEEWLLAVCIVVSVIVSIKGCFFPYTSMIDAILPNKWCRHTFGTWSDGTESDVKVCLICTNCGHYTHLYTPSAPPPLQPWHRHGRNLKRS